MADFSFPEPHSSSASKRKKRRLLRPCDRSDWSGLPSNVLFSIMDKLIDVHDYVRFGAVCVLWRRVFLEEISSARPRPRPTCCSAGPPFLLIPPPPQAEAATVDDQKMALCRLSTGRVYDFRLQVPHHKVCRGSSLGWLVTLETKALHDCGIQLQNPFLNRTIDLPSVDALVQQHPEGDRPWEGYYLNKAVLSSDPVSSPGSYVVMAIMGKYSGLAFFRAGGTSWTSIGDWRGDWSRGDLFDDVIFSCKTNRFYAVLKSGAVLAIDLVGDIGNPKLTQIASPIIGARRRLTYLVEDLSSGDLFQVFKNFNAKYSKEVAKGKNGEKTSYRANVTAKFIVFKLNTSFGNWVQIHDLGENILFLGNSGSMLRSVSDCPGCEPNCIYYTDDADITYRSNFSCCGPPYDGVYNLKDGVLRSHYSDKWSRKIEPWGSSLTSSTKVLPQPIWLEPTLRCCN